MTARQRSLPIWPGYTVAAAGALLLFPTAFLTGWSGVGYAGIALYLGGAYWVGFAGGRVLGHALLVIAVVTGLGLKLFTAEVTQPGAPATGVVVKDSPSLISRVDRADRVADPPVRYIYGPGPDRHGAEAFYHPVVRAGWIAALVVLFLAWASWIPLARIWNLNVPFPRRRKGWRKPKGTRRRIIHYGLGYMFLVLGVLGLFLPILQGILFLVIGFLLLGRVSPRVRLQRLRLRRRYPKWAHRYDQWEDAAKDWLRGHFRLPWRKKQKRGKQET